MCGGRNMRAIFLGGPKIFLDTDFLLDIVYTNDYILDVSEELFMTCDWSYELTVERLHTILQHRFGSFKLS